MTSDDAPAAVTNPPRARNDRRAGPGAAVACPLLLDALMHHDPRSWRRLTPETIAQLPEVAAVFEVANLVRTVKYIGGAGGNLRARVAGLTTDPSRFPPSAGGYYVRYEPADSEADAHAQRLAAYQAMHRGGLPAGNREQPVALRVAPRRAA